MQLNGKPMTDEMFEAFIINLDPEWKEKKEWHRQAVEKIRQEEAAREQRKRAQVQAMSHQNRIQNTGGWQSGMAKDPGFMSGKGTSAEMGSFNRGGLAGLWQR